MMGANSIPERIKNFAALSAKRLGLEPIRVATQIVPRSSERYAEFVFSLTCWASL